MDKDLEKLVADLNIEKSGFYYDNVSIKILSLLTKIFKSLNIECNLHNSEKFLFNKDNFGINTLEKLKKKIDKGEIKPQSALRELEEALDFFSNSYFDEESVSFLNSTNLRMLIYKKQAF